MQVPWLGFEPTIRWLNHQNVNLMLNYPPPFHPTFTNFDMYCPIDVKCEASKPKVQILKIKCSKKGLWKKKFLRFLKDLVVYFLESICVHDCGLTLAIPCLLYNFSSVLSDRINMRIHIYNSQYIKKKVFSKDLLKKILEKRLTWCASSIYI